VGVGGIGLEIQSSFVEYFLCFYLLFDQLFGGIDFAITRD